MTTNNVTAHANFLMQTYDSVVLASASVLPAWSYHPDKDTS